MLTKKAKAAADTIREEIGALIKQGETVAKFYEQTDRHYLTARRLWHCWQWFNSYESTHDQPEEAAKAKEAHDTNPREWVQTVDKLAEEMEAAAACTFADGFRVRCVGWVRGLVLPVLFTENKEEKERAHLVRFEW